MSEPKMIPRHIAECFLAVGLVLGFCLLLLARDPGFFWNDDYQVQYLPASHEISRAWETGESTLLSPSSWFGGALAGEYQHGSFSIFIQAVCVLIWKLNLTLPSTAAAFSLIHLAVLAAGTFYLARQRNLSADLAIFAAVVASLNGWIICWAATDWIPALTSFAWIPWSWWALERSLKSERGLTRFLPAGFFIYLILTAGWPFSVLMMGVTTLFVILRHGLQRHRLQRQSLQRQSLQRHSLAGLWPVIAAWVWGCLLAAPALLMLVEYVRIGLRVEHHQGLQWQWVVPPTALVGLFAPSFSSEWYGWGGRYARPAIELASGLVPQVMLAAALFRFRLAFARAFRWDLIALGSVLLLSVLPSTAPFQMSFRWLPLFHLLLGLLGAHALSALRSDEATRAASPAASTVREASIWLVAACLVFPILEWSVLIISSSLFLDLDFVFQVSLAALVLLLIILSILLFKRSRLPRVRGTKECSWHGLPCVVVLLSLWSTYSAVSTRWVARWDFPETLRQIEPLSPEMEYLGLYSKEEAYFENAALSNFIRPGNTAMHSGAHLVNGYSPIRPAGLATTLGLPSHLGFSSEPRARRILEQEVGREGMLELMGVDGLVLARSLQEHVASVVGKGWEVVFTSDEGAVLHRTAPLSEKVRTLPSAVFVDSPEEISERVVKRKSLPVPFLLLHDGSQPQDTVVPFAPCKLEIRDASRLRVEVDIESLSSDSSSLVLFSRPWYPGYRATLNGQPLPVQALNRMLPAVEVPAGAQGLLVLAYSPASLRIGLGMSTLGLILGACTVAAGQWHRRRTSLPGR